MATPKNKNKQLTRRQRGIIRAKSDFFRTARYGLSLQEHRIVYYAILKGQQDKRPFEPVDLSIKDFKELCGLKGESTYSSMRNLTKKLSGRVVEVIYKDNDGQHLIQAPWLSSIVYHAKEGRVTIEPNKALQPFFEGKPFTETEFYFLIKFTSQHAERLYEILKSLNFKPLVDFDIEDLRQRLYIREEQYTNFKDLRRRVLEPAIRDINEFTDLEISMRTKNGPKNKVEIIYFTIDKKEISKLAERVYKSEFAPPLSEEEQKLFMQQLIDEDVDAIEIAPSVQLDGQLVIENY